MGLLLVHAAATLALVGLIWTVQLVHYPLMAQVGAAGYPGYQAAHERRITLLVGPLMVVEGATAVWIALVPPPGVDPALAWAGVVLVALIWAVTRAVSVPCHARLRHGFDRRAHERLVRTNWLRTAAWTARGAIALVLLASAG